MLFEESTKFTELLAQFLCSGELESCRSRKIFLIEDVKSQLI